MGMTTRRARFVGSPLPVAVALGCGSHGESSLDVGSDEGGPSFLVESGAAGGGALDAYVEDSRHIAVTFVTLSCAESCATCAGRRDGGYPPYTFKWDDGSTSPTRQVCPKSSTRYSVSVTDKGTSGLSSLSHRRQYECRWSPA